jgi:hypothetical protein
MKLPMHFGTADKITKTDKLLRINHEQTDLFLREEQSEI